MSMLSFCLSLLFGVYGTFVRCTWSVWIGSSYLGIIFMDYWWCKVYVILVVETSLRLLTFNQLWSVKQARPFSLCTLGTLYRSLKDELCFQMTCIWRKVYTWRTKGQLLVFSIYLTWFVNLICMLAFDVALNWLKYLKFWWTLYIRYLTTRTIIYCIH